MGTASFAQISFLGGEWSKQTQGRFDREDYRTGLNVCLNIIPIEEGAAPRRSGTRLGGITRNGAYAVAREYSIDQAQPYTIELTAGHLRLWQAGSNLVVHPGTAISDTLPSAFTALGHGLAVGDQVIFTAGPASTYAGTAQVLGRQLTVDFADTTTFTVVDALTGASIDSSLIDLTTVAGLTVYKIYDLVTPYTEADLQQVRIVQDGVNAVLLHPSYPPQTLTITQANGVFSSATLAATSFYDGPYLDIPTDGTTLTPSATSGSITFTASSIVSINNGQGFLFSDVGRMFRVFSEPATWASGTGYGTGALVKNGGVYWKAVTGSTGVEPSSDDGTHWIISTTAAAWTWGTIQSISSTSAFVGTLHAAVSYPDNTAGGNLLYVLPISAWQLGAYSAVSGYPSCGAYYQGRIWLGGAAKNRFDACVSNDFGQNGYINFAPTGLDGTVADNNGISGTLNAREIENFLWMLPDEQGILAGTQSGEWIIASSSAQEPITPTSIQAREMTHYGSRNHQAVKIGRAAIFVHRDTRKIYEYMANYFTQKFVADHLSLKSKHLTEGGVAELAYMRELAPVIWARLDNGGLIGCTYKHDDPIKPLEFAAWHRHQLGTGRNVISIQTGPANEGQTDTLALITQDTTTGYCYVETLQTIWDAEDDLRTAWYVDGGISIAAAERINSTTVRLYGLWYMVGESVTVWGAGLDLGDYTVTADGTIDLPLNAAQSLFTDAYLASVTALGCTSLATEFSGNPTPAYIMTAEENYDNKRISYIDGLVSYSSVYINTDQNYQGVQWDPVRRNLMYMYIEDTPETPHTNTTGFSLWDGQSTISPGSAVNPSEQFNASVGTKNIDTGEVSYHLCYTPNSVVPGSVAGDGTWRRFTRDFLSDAVENLGNGPGMTDPRTGDFWINSQSCELYCFRNQDSYAQIISPLYPKHGINNDVMILGFSDSGATGPWSYAREISETAGVSSAYLYLVPRLLTAAEITADYLLAYATFNYPVTMADSQRHYPAYNREIFDHSGNMYLFSCTRTGGKNFKLYKFTAPTSAPYGGPTVGGGFTDITPWAAGTGPNADASGYTLARPYHPVSGLMTTADIIPIYQPITNHAWDNLVLIEKFFPSEHTAASADPALMFWSCTYVNNLSPGPTTWEHHSAFVTGYMTAGWATTDINGAAYAVMDAFEVNSYLGQSDYLYGIDYTKRWFFFACTKMVNGVSDGKPRIVLVEYQFTYGQAPQVVQVIDEQGWDDAYPGKNHSSDAYVPFTEQDTQAVAVAMTTSFNTDYYHSTWDIGVHDPITNSFWWGGGGTDRSQTAFFGIFDPKFSRRQATFFGGPPGGSHLAATPPFMKLSFAQNYCAPFAVGHTFTSQGQILRPATPQEAQTQSGPAQGKKRRMTYAAPLLFDAQGVSMGVDFLKMRTLDLKSPGGTVSIPLTQTFSGVYWGTVDADENYDNMWCWQITRPYPCTVVSVECQLKTNENL